MNSNQGNTAENHEHHIRAATLINSKHIGA